MIISSRFWLRLVLVVALAGLLVSLKNTSLTEAAINRQINFQGKIVNNDGTNIANGNYNMEFRIYSGGDGVPGGGDETLQWTEQRLNNNTAGVTITNGIFQVNLGSVTPLPGTVDFDNDTLWLSMNLGNTNGTCTPFTSCSGDGEMNPMVRFTAAPYALNSDLLDGLSSAAFGQLSQNQTWTGTNTLQPTTNITSAIVKQTTAASPTADIFNVQTANNTNIIQITGPAANEAAVTISSIGASRALTLDSASGTLVLGSNTTTVQKSGTSLTFDVNSASASTLTITNAGAGVASLSVEGDISTTASSYANNFDRTSAGVLGLGNTNATSASICNSTACDTVSIATNADADAVNIGDSSDTLTFTGNSSTTFVFNGTTLSVAELNLLDGRDNALVDTNDSVNTAITGTGALDAGSITSNFGAINVGADAITTSGTIGTAGTTTFTGGTATFAGTVNINNSGTGNTTIGNTAGGTITIGAASGSDLVLQDAQWGVTGPGAASFASVNSGSGTITTTGTIGTVGTTTFTGAGATFTSVNSGSGTIQTTGSVLGNDHDRTTSGVLGIGNTNATSVSICNSAACDTINIGTNTDADTINIGDSNDTINLAGRITGVGLADCDTGNSKLTYDSTAQSFGCSTLEARSFVDTTADAVQDNNTTNYWDEAVENGTQHPNLTLTSTSNEIFGIVSTEVTGTGTQDTEVSFRAERNLGSDPTCNSATQVGGTGGIFHTNTSTVKSSTFTFLDAPASVTTAYYTLCADTATVGTNANISRIRFTLFELNNAADLAEVYPTNDYGLEPGDVVSLDPDLANGVKTSDKAYDKGLFGVISTEPALVIGGTNGHGNGAAVALSGRVPVKVNAENGPIKKGDVLTTSSVPGVAMKATKAGSMLGVAMDDFIGEGQGTVMVFVKTGSYNGSNLAEIMKSDNYNSSEEDFNIAALNYFLDNNTEVPALDVSEILTDRVAAGIELITPKVTTDKLITNNIHAATGKDVSINLAGDGQLVLKGSGGEQLVSFGASGAQFAGSLGVSLDLSAGGQIFASGGLSVGGPADFGGQTVFRRMVSYLDRVIFGGDVKFEGRTEFNNDTGGFATIYKSQQEVKVKFDDPYVIPPIVTVAIKNGEFANYSYKDLSKDGFTIVLAETAENDIEFSWTALSITEPRTAHEPLPAETAPANAQ